MGSIVADDKPILWAPLVEGLGHAEKFSLSRLVAESDLPGLLRAGALPWRGERRGGLESDFESGDPRVWGGESEDADRPVAYLAPKWEENLLLRILHPGRAILRVRLAPRKIYFVRIMVDMGRLRALMPLDAPAEANPKIARETPRETPRGPRSAGRKKDTKLLKSDRALYPDVARRLAEGESLAAATRAQGEGLAGTGTLENRAKRLERNYRNERRGI
jgi:hypothetical protein